MKDRKRIKLEYKLREKVMGVFTITNKVNRKIYLGSSTILDKIFDRYKFELKLAGYPVPEFQEDWNEYGEESFSFEILEELPDEGYSLAKNKKLLKKLEDKWREQLKNKGYIFYN